LALTLSTALSLALLTALLAARSGRPHSAFAATLGLLTVTALLLTALVSALLVLFLISVLIWHGISPLLSVCHRNRLCETADLNDQSKTTDPAGTSLSGFVQIHENYR
jgi:hypothetical protein